MNTSFERSVSGKDEWLTPKYIIEALGEFDLDPCSPIVRPWNTAKRHYTIEDDGLTKDWGSDSKVFMNPPYGNQTSKWMKKLSEHGNGIALIFARTETRMFFDYIWNKAHAIMFLKGRLSFYNVDGTKGKNSAGAPSCLVAYGLYNEILLQRSGLNGKYIKLIA